MTERVKFEQMLESLINGDQKQAEEIFHELVVAKSREIYENLLDDDIQVADEELSQEDFELDEVGADPADDMMADLEGGDEEGEEGEEGDDEEGGDEPATKDDILDIKDALEDIRAEFEAMMAGKAGAKEEPVQDDVQFEAMEDDEEGDENANNEKTKEDLVREYVEKVAPAKMGDNGANTKSIVAKPNNNGGTSVKTGSGSPEAGGKTPASKDMATGNVNVPGAKKAATLNKVSEPKGGDDGVNKKSTLGA